MDYKYYINSVDFYTDVKKLIPSLDFNKTLRLLDQCFFIDGVYQPTPLINLSLARMNELIGEEVFCAKRSIVFGGAYTVYLLKGKESFEAMLNKEQVAHAKAPKVVKEVEQPKAPEGKEPDWAWIDTLKNNKADKEALDVYALEEFNVILNQSKTLANMIKSFKKEL